MKTCPRDGTTRRTSQNTCVECKRRDNQRRRILRGAFNDTTPHERQEIQSLEGIRPALQVAHEFGRPIESIYSIWNQS